jgi:hypothetical protein
MNVHNRGNDEVHAQHGAAAAVHSRQRADETDSLSKAALSDPAGLRWDLQFQTRRVI